VLKSLPGAERVLQNYAVILRLDTDCSYPTLAEAASVRPHTFSELDFITPFKVYV